MSKPTPPMPTTKELSDAGVTRIVMGDTPAIDDGGAAFPAHDMSLRDWFAGQALASMTAAPDYSKGPCDAAMGERAYRIADAMLAARKAPHV